MIATVAVVALHKSFNSPMHDFLSSNGLKNLCLHLIKDSDQALLRLTERIYISAINPAYRW